MRSADFRDDGQCVDLANLLPPPFGASDPVAQAIASSDDRAAALISAAVGVHARDSKSGKLEGIHGKPKIIWENQGGKLIPNQPWFQDWDLSEFKWYDGKAPSIYLLRSKCLAVMAYLDFFPDVNWPGLRPFVSSVVASANTGWCGTFGPGVDNAFDILGDPAEGNYDMNEMHLIPLAYRHYQDLTSVAREHLINVVLGSGRVHRPGRKDGFTSGKAPDDWTRAGYFHVQLGPFDPGKGIDETENHILMINSARYLTNQLLWQRTHILDTDNRRNGGDGSPSCLDLTLSLLRNILRDDFSEYNAKNYQEETRYSLLNLCTYAYDHEVRLGARMVLDYISAHMAVSTNDLRRMVPFRRRDEDDKVAHDAQGFMSVNLLAASGSDPMGPYFAMQAGNTRACVATLDVPVPVGGMPGGAPGESKQPGINGSQQDVAIEMLTDYRLPPSIHDLFVNDAHRRFFQRIHRIQRPDEAGGNRNCDNAEIYASSPSYLITAGGSGATYAIDPSIIKGSGVIISPSKYQQELGVAVTTSFMPTTGAGGFDPQTSATDLIQFSSFSDDPVPADDDENGVANYGVAPDFACGHQIYLPKWTKLAAGGSGFSFGDFGSSGGSGKADGPGFYLAIFQENGLALMEAFDTWLHPNVTFADFQIDVLKRNPKLHLNGNTPTWYTTWNGNQIQFVIWTNGEYAGAKYGAAVLSMKYGNIDVQDALGDAGNINTPFLNGTIMSSPAEAVVEIRNPFLGTVIRLDMSDKWHPKRTAEDGSVEWAGSNEEVWLDFQWPGPTDGDVCHPFNTLSAASADVANYGTIRIIPSLSHERGPIGLGKRFKLVAPIAGVTIGAR
jgi:hypothetical protein